MGDYSFYGAAEAAPTTTAPLVPITALGLVSGAQNNVIAASGTWEQTYTALADVTALDLIYGAHTAIAGSVDTDFSALATPAPLTNLKTWVQPAGGGWTPVTFAGQTSTALAAGRITSDPVPVTLTQGQTFKVRTHAAAPAAFPANVGAFALHDGAAYGAGEVPPPAALAATTSFMFGPRLVRGRPAAGRPSTVAVVGDSITSGMGDGTAANNGRYGTVSFVKRALNAAGVPWVDVSVPGERGSGFASGTSSRLRLPYLDGCTAAVEAFGINDLTDGATAEALANTRLAIARALRARGATRVYVTTVTPRSTSTDSWATVEGQTTHALNARRVAFNDWLRAGAPLTAAGAYASVGTGGTYVVGHPAHPWSGYFEVADAVESARGSGLWKAGICWDGLHPRTEGHVLMAAALAPSRFW